MATHHSTCKSFCNCLLLLLLLLLLLFVVVVVCCLLFVAVCCCCCCLLFVVVVCCCLLFVVCCLLLLSILTFFFRFVLSFSSRAVFKNNLKIIKILLEESRSTNILINLSRNNGVTPLLMSIKFEHVEIVRYLVRDDDDDDDEEEEDDNEVEDDENDEKEMKRQRKRNVLKNLNVNQTQLSGQSPLYAACMLGNVEIVRLLMEREDVDVNQRCTAGSGDMTSLLFSCEKGNIEIVKLLLKSKKILLNKATIQNGSTPLFIACQRGQSKIVELLLTRNVTRIVNTKNGKARNGKVRVGDGEDEDGEGEGGGERCAVNQAQHNGVTPLLIACQNGHRECVALLMKEKEIEIDREVHGFSPLKLARYHQRNDIVREINGEEEVVSEEENEEENEEEEEEEEEEEVVVEEVVVEEVVVEEVEEEVVGEVIEVV